MVEICDHEFQHAMTINVINIFSRYSTAFKILYCGEKHKYEPDQLGKVQGLTNCHWVLTSNSHTKTYGRIHLQICAICGSVSLLWAKECLDSCVVPSVLMYILDKPSRQDSFYL